MTTTVLAIAAAYVIIGVLLLAMGLMSRFAWWIKAVAIVVTSAFFIEVFFATSGLLGWPGSGHLPARFQLLWTRVVEPDAKIGDRGSVFLWIEEVDENNVPSGVPRAYRLPYSRLFADRAIEARDAIMSGKPQEGSATNGATETMTDQNLQQPLTRAEPGASGLNISKKLRDAPHVEFRPMTTPVLPPKP